MSADDFAALWLVVFLILAAIGALYAGYEHDAEAAVVLLAPAAFWPIVILAIVICGPFVGLYHLGKLISNWKYGDGV